MLGSTASNPAQSCTSDNQSATATTPSQPATSTATLTSPVDAVAQSTEVTSEDPLSSTTAASSPNSSSAAVTFASLISIPVRHRPNKSGCGSRGKLPSSNLASPEHLEFVKDRCAKKAMKLPAKSSDGTPCKPRLRMRVVGDKGTVRSAPIVQAKKNKVDQGDDVGCLYCNEWFSESRGPNRNWIQCTGCNRWAHCVCAGVDIKTISFTCELCG